MAAADVVFTGGSVFTGGRSAHSGLAVADGRIAAVAPDEELRSPVGKGTDVVDLAGGLLTPGFQDAHVHPRGGEPHATGRVADGAGVPAAPAPVARDGTDAYTLGSARVSFLDDVTGTVQVGKDADLAVHDRDPFAGPAEEIGRTRVVRTYVQGRLVHQGD